MNITEPREVRKVVLIEPQSPGIHVFTRFKLPRLGLPLLGAVLKRELGVEVKIFFQELSRIDYEEVRSADLVGISTITSTAPEAYNILRRVKNAYGTPVVMGGPHVSFLPEEALQKGADFVVRGEGEATLVELVGSLTTGEVPLEDIAGLSYRDGASYRHNPDRERMDELSSLPWPDLTLIEGYERSRIVPVMTSRGCPYDCKFCSVTGLFGRKYRFREIEDVVRELETLYSRNPKGVFFFYDDNFTASPRHTKELLRRLKEKGITPRWTAQARVDVVDDAELMELMRDTGCTFLYLGLESSNPATLKEYRKGQTVEDVERAVRVIHRYGIKVHGMFVLGSDSDDLESIRGTVRFAKRTSIDTVQFLILTPLPGTETYQELCSQGRLIIDDWSKFTGHHVVYEPRNMSAFQLQKEAGLRAMRKFYSLWQCWRLGLVFHFKDMAIRVYGHRYTRKWLARNRDYLGELKRRYKEDKRWRKLQSKSEVREPGEKETVKL